MLCLSVIWIDYRLEGVAGDQMDRLLMGIDGLLAKLALMGKSNGMEEKWGPIENAFLAFLG